MPDLKAALVKLFNEEAEKILGPNHPQLQVARDAWNAYLTSLGPVKMAALQKLGALEQNAKRTLHAIRRGLA